MPQASASVRTMCRPRPCGASATWSCGVGKPRGTVGDLDPHAVAVGRDLDLHLEIGRGMLHRIGRQLRQHQHECVRLAVAGAGQLGEQEPPGLAHGRCGRREAARRQRSSAYA